MARTYTISQFDDERENAIESMIQTRKDTWKPIAEERQEIRNELGQALAERDFIEAKGYFDDDKEIKPIVEKINKLTVQYNDHVEKYKSLAEQLDKEMVILENLKHR